MPKILSKDADSYPFMYKNYPFLRPWVDSLKQVDALKDTFIINPHGIQLHAYYVAAPQPTSKTAVIVHGYTDNAIRMFMQFHQPFVGRCRVAIRFCASSKVSSSIKGS